MCGKDDANKNLVKTKVKSVKCSFGKKMRINLESNSEVAWKTDPEASNQDDFVRAYFKNTL